MVLFFTRGMSLAGWERAGMFERELALYRALSLRLGEVALLTYGGKEELSFRKCLGPIRVLPNRWRLGANLYSIMAPLLHQRAIRCATVVKTNQLNGAWSGVIAKLLFRKRLVVRGGYLWSRFVAHEAKGGWRPRVAKCLERASLAAADVIVVTGESDRRVLVDSGVAGTKIRVIPNYVDTHLFRPDPEIPREPGRVCFVGRLDEQKNPAVLLEAMRGVAGARLTIVGDGPLRHGLENKAADDRLPVEFLGILRSAELPAVLNRSQVFVLPSLYEGQPKALLEAMACGVPVVGTDAPGIRDIIRHGDTGVLCGHRPVEIAGAIRELLENPDRSRQMAARARGYVVGEYSLTRVVEKELAVLVELAGD